MLVCDSCEGREDVQLTRIVGGVKTAYEGNDTFRPAFVEETRDLCIRCRNNLARTIKEAVAPQPKCVVG